MQNQEIHEPCAGLAGGFGDVDTGIGGEIVGCVWFDATGFLSLLMNLLLRSEKKFLRFSFAFPDVFFVILNGP